MELETDYRSRIQEIFHRIEKALENIDPDIAECEQSMGALAIVFSNRSKCILSAQPSVRQLWLALAAEGVAYHFNFQNDVQKWLDDKGRGIELISFLNNYFKEVAGIDVNI